MMYVDDTISAVATALGEGSIGIIRLSGPRSLEIADRIFHPVSGKKLGKYPHNTLVYGHIIDMDAVTVDELIDKADKALYRVKTSGKNRYEFYKQL